MKENCHNSRTSDDIDMKLGSLTELDKRNKTTSKNLTMASCQQIVTSWSFFRFMTNSERSGSQIPDTQSVKLTFSLIVTFYLTKTENSLETEATYGYEIWHECFL